MFKQVNQSNSYIDILGDNLYLKSYNSIVASYNTNTKVLILGSHWNYGNTTRKHLYKFFRDNNISVPKCNKDIIKLIGNGEIELLNNNDMFNLYYKN